MPLTKDQAIKACKAGAYAAFVSAGVTLIVLLAALYANSTEGLLGVFNDPSVFVDVFVVALCGFGMLRRSRAAAITVLCYAIFSRAFIWLETGQVSGVLTALIFLYFYARAIQGAYVFHRMEKAENPAYRPAARWMYWVGIPAGVLVAVAMVFGLLTMTSTLPSTNVLSGNEVSADERATLVELDIIQPDEEILYFYSDALASIADAGNILTDARVIRYFSDEQGELAIYELYLDEIGGVRLESPGSLLSDSVYRVFSHDPEAWFEIALPAEAGGDVLFVEALQERIK